MLFLKALILGFSVSAPLGPIGLLCIQRTLDLGRKAGFATGFGAAAANLLYAGAAVLGFSTISSFLIKYEMYLSIMGSIFLIYIGIRAFMKEEPASGAVLKGRTPYQMFAATLLLMLTNPSTILNFAVMFTGIGAAGEAGASAHGAALLTGVFLGASTWWALLVIIISKFRSKFSGHLPLINKAAGLMIILLACITLADLWHG
ncbi:LysE family translocator [Peribacillus sp. SCS-37]|uniref:LysE family translocator n=1 Tax=Paraperibacillus esterisolvens TaxID=3115296 RepID=UPI003906419F